MASPALASLAIGQQVDSEELGGWKLHSEITGLVDCVTETDEEAIELIRRFLAYLPSHNQEAPPKVDVPAGSDDRAATLSRSFPKTAGASMMCAKSFMQSSTRGASLN